MKTVNKVKRQLNPKLQIGGILLTMVEGRSNFSKDIGRLLRESYGNKIKVYETEIPRGIKAAETSAEGKSIYAFDGKGKQQRPMNSLRRRFWRMKSSARKIQLASYDDLFKNDEERLADTQENQMLSQKNCSRFRIIRLRLWMMTK